MMIGGMGSRQGVRIDERAVFKWTLHTKIGWTAQLYVVADEEITARNTKYRPMGRSEEKRDGNTIV